MRHSPRATGQGKRRRQRWAPRAGAEGAGSAVEKGKSLVAETWGQRKGQLASARGEGLGTLRRKALLKRAGLRTALVACCPHRLAPSCKSRRAPVARRRSYLLLPSGAQQISGNSPHQRDIVGLLTVSNGQETLQAYCAEPYRIRFVLRCSWRTFLLFTCSGYCF